MKTVLLLVVALFYALAIPSQANAQDRPATFEAKEREEIVGLLLTEISDSDTNALVNRTYDIVFKVLLFIVSGLAAIGAARVAALGATVPPVWLKTSNLALTALAPLITSLAFTQFDFAKRQAVWERRHYALVACKMSIQFTNPGREAFLNSLDAILRWGDANSLNELTASCVGKPATPGGTPTPPTPAASPAAATSPAAPASAAAVPSSQPRK
jgi:hypothetical protein